MIRLKRNATIQIFEVSGTIAEGDERPEFLAVAQLAADLDRPISAEDICTQLLGLKNLLIGNRVIERCVYLGLLEKIDEEHAQIAEKGYLALKHNSVLTPREGTWEIWALDDPLIDEPVIRITSSIPPKAMQAREKRSRSKTTPPLPEKLREGRILAPLLEKGLFEIQELKTSAVLKEAAVVQLELQWQLNADPVVKLHGKIRGKSLDSPFPEPPQCLKYLTYPELWRKLVSVQTDYPVDIRALEEWEAEVGKVVVPVHWSEDVPQDVLRRFQVDLNIPKTTCLHQEIGPFDSTVLDNTPVVPKSNEDATHWAKWLQWETMNGYQTVRNIQDHAQKITEFFPHHRITLHSIEELLAYAKKQPVTPKSYQLLAPSDLGLWR